MLYAFDGTGNRDNVDASQDTNVVKFRDAYDGQNLYYKGIGTRWGVPGAILGGTTGAGGRGRVSEAYEQFKFFVAEGDAVVDIIGFSRGAALALHFANEVAQHPGSPTVRFLGIWDSSRHLAPRASRRTSVGISVCPPTSSIASMPSPWTSGSTLPSAPAEAGGAGAAGCALRGLVCRCAFGRRRREQEHPPVEHRAAVDAPERAAVRSPSSRKRSGTTRRRWSRGPCRRGDRATIWSRTVSPRAA